MVTVGSHDIYEWLVTDLDFDLIEVCPDIVIVKYVAVTSIDSGIFEPTEKELAAGWHMQQNIAYSPKIRDIHDLPRAGWDEWYIFQNPTDIGTSHIKENIFEVPHDQGHVSDFVNYNFALDRPGLKTLVDLFWPQIARLQPESFIADGGYYLNFVTLNKALFAAVRTVVERLEQE